MKRGWIIILAVLFVALSAIAWGITPSCYGFMEKKKPTILADYGDAQYGYPKFQWVGDDTLIIDLGKVDWIKPKIHRAGSIQIT
jgi:hypothetical protein